MLANRKHRADSNPRRLFDGYVEGAGQLVTSVPCGTVPPARHFCLNKRKTVCQEPRSCSIGERLPRTKKGTLKKKKGTHKTNSWGFPPLRRRWSQMRAATGDIIYDFRWLLCFSLGGRVKHSGKGGKHKNALHINMEHINSYLEELPFWGPCWIPCQSAR